MGLPENYPPLLTPEEVEQALRTPVADDLPIIDFSLLGDTEIDQACKQEGSHLKELLRKVLQKCK